MIEWWTALALGLLGSFHCAGMCGPLVLALPPGGHSRWVQAGQGLLYHAGKSLAYGLVGLVAGILGAGVALAGYQQVLSVVVGGLMLVAVALPRRWTSFLFSTPVGGGFYTVFSRVFKSLVHSKSALAFGTLGFINGFLPCGLVYMALGASMVSGHAWSSAIFMFIFGAGTMPMLLGIFLARNLLTISWKQKLTKVVPYGLALVSVLLILRGLSLGIPYVSPRPPAAAVSSEHDCCH